MRGAQETYTTSCQLPTSSSLSRPLRGCSGLKGECNHKTRGPGQTETIYPRSLNDVDVDPKRSALELRSDGTGYFGEMWYPMRHTPYDRAADRSGREKSTQQGFWGRVRQAWVCVCKVQSKVGM